MTTESQEKYRVALVGTGGISRGHATACENSDRAELVAVCDVSDEALERFTQQFGGAICIFPRWRRCGRLGIRYAVISSGGFACAGGNAVGGPWAGAAVLCEKPYYAE